MVKIVGILNITPDSFSDGNFYNNAASAAKQLVKLIKQGAEVIDIGAISTRPGSLLISPEEEIARFKEILPSVVPLVRESKIEISIDSFHAETIRFLLDYLPISWINDQRGFIDKELLDIARENNLKIVLMHQLGIPANPKLTLNLEVDVVLTVKNWLLSRADDIINQGIDKKQIIIDPGIGFGKSHEQAWQLINSAQEFVETGFSVLYGHSRKSFLNVVTNVPFAERDLETAIISYELAKRRVDYLRVHNVEANKRAINFLNHIL